MAACQDAHVLDADAVIAALGMQPHPEGGHYVETWRGGDQANSGRASATAIYFLLRPGERSHWHRVDADEVWLHHAGGPIELSITIGGESRDLAHHRLGHDVAAGERPQVVVPAGAWQAAAPIDTAALVSCVVVPGFEFAGFELAPDGWEPT